MIIRLRPTQINPYWEIIKFAAITSNNVEEKNISKFSINLLLDLLNNKVHCLVSVNDERKIDKILLVSFMYNEIMDEKYMKFQAFYAFITTPPEEWKVYGSKILEYAKKEKCNSIYMTTKSPKIIELVERFGLTESSKNYSIDL